MKTIVAGQSKVKKILGKQELRKVEYRFNKYLLRVDYNDGILLHNVITGKMVYLNSDEMVFIKSFSGFIEEQQYLKELVEDYFLVPNDFDEKTLVQQLRKIMKMVFSSDEINSYTILTTTNCNARCFYCYQKNFDHVNMDSKTADHVVDFILKHKGRKPLCIYVGLGESL
jgi:sulfatase maturation enzyme AslB (radical SAM superfamily)